MRNDRYHPNATELQRMPMRELLKYAQREAEFLEGQKQTAVPRLLREMIRRLK